MFLLSWPGGDWQATAKIVLAVIIVFLAAVWLALIFWTYRDIRQRSRDPVMQTVAVLVVLLFFLPGQWIYLIVRPRYTLTELYERSLEEEALLQELEDQKACPSCRRRVRDEFLICPSCRAQLKEPCRSCGKPLNYAWVACPYCGLEKPAREPVGGRQVRAGNRPGGGSGRPAQRPAAQRPAPRPAAAASEQMRPATAAASGTTSPSTDGPVHGPIQQRRGPLDPFGPRPTAKQAAGDDSPVIGGESPAS